VWLLGEKANSTMTAHKHLKQLVRARMSKTGERYATARRRIVGQSTSQGTDPALRWHFPGNVSAATALRVLLAHGGYRLAGNSEPLSEAMTFGLAGGIGFGMFTFFYEKEDFASFFVAGRHLWQDDVAYFNEGGKRLGFKSIIKESGSTKLAERQLRDGLADGPCAAWIDMAALPHRGITNCPGPIYHIVAIYKLNDTHAWIGDLTDQPVQLHLKELATARAAIKKQKNRLLWLPPAKSPLDVKQSVRDALRACHLGMTKQRMKNFTIEALKTWADRLHGSKEKESWERIFAPPRLWNGLTMAHEFIEYYGTGGGLCRPLFAEFLREAGGILGDARLVKLSDRYARLGAQWTDLAHACLPDHVAECREARALYQQRSEARESGGPEAELKAARDALTALQQQVRQRFPLTDKQCDDLRAELQGRVRALYEGETAALDELVRYSS
jgi:hypothetical protein